MVGLTFSSRSLPQVTSCQSMLNSSENSSIEMGIFLYYSVPILKKYLCTNWKGFPGFHFVYSSIFSLRCEVCLNLECKGEEVHY